MRLPCPDSTTLFKNAEKFQGEYFRGIVEQATANLCAMGVEESIDPQMLMHSGVTPEYSAPQKIPVCQADEDEQRKKNEEAEELRRCMEVMAFAEFSGTRVEEVAVDGSGEGLKGPGIYFEYIWDQSNRKFVKMHPALDICTRKVVCFSVTLKRPGDSKVLAPLLRGMEKCGISVGRVYADGAYDGKENWKATISLGIDFEPNLDRNFKADPDLPERNAKLAREKEIGKKAYHRASGYNQRWLVEVFFSVFKKLYGERLRNRKFRRMVLEMRYKFCLYNIHRDHMLAVERAAEARLDICLIDV